MSSVASSSSISASTPIATSPSVSVSVSASSSSIIEQTQYHQQRLNRTAELCKQYATLHMQPLTTRALYLHTRLRDERTDTAAFVAIGDQLLRQLMEFALSQLPVDIVTVTTPCAEPFVGCQYQRPLCGVSIIRAGESMENALRSLVPDVRIGKILIQRDETSKEKNAIFYYSKLPPQISECQVFVLDPMLATGGSAACAIKHLLSVGVPIDRISFVCLISSPEGIEALLTQFPRLTLVSGMLDEKLDERKYILPGIGDFGDRYFGTVETKHEEGGKFITTNATTASDATSDK